MIKYSYIVIAGLFSVVVFFCNTRLYYSPDHSSGDNAANTSEIMPQLRYLKDAIESGAAEEMQDIFPEGYFFTHALYGLTWAEICTRIPQRSELWNKGQKEALRALGKLDSDDAKQIFEKDMDPPYGAFYVSWRTWFRGVLLKSQPSEERDSNQIVTFLNDCQALSEAFEKKRTPFIETYPHATWPADVLIGVAALKLHDCIFDARYTGVITRWLIECKKRLDPATGLIPHSVDSETGYPSEGARGSSQSLMLKFLYDIDPGFAREQYLKFKKHFVTSFFGLPCVREYPKGVKGSGDVDSGPVIFGIGATVTIVSLSTAKVFNDRDFYRPLEQTIETLGLPMTYNSRKRYLFGYLPMGDAFLAWSKNAMPIIGAMNSDSYGNVVGWWWRLPYHLSSTFIVLLLWLPFNAKRKRLQT